MNSRHLVLCTCLYVTSIAPVYAATIHYSGTLAFVYDPFSVTSISVGDLFSGHFTYGDSVSDVTSPPILDPNEALYSFVGSPYNASVSDGVNTETNTQLRMDIENNVTMDAGFASILTGLHGGTFTEGSLFDNWNINAWSDTAIIDPPNVVGDDDPDFYTGGGWFFSIDVLSVDSSLYSGVDYQKFPPPLGGSNYGRFRIVLRDTDGTLAFDASGSLDSLTAVPLPSAVWLFGSGLLGLVGIARQKKA